MSQETVNGMHHSKGSQVMPVNLNRWLLPVLALWFLFVTSSGSKTLLPSSTPFLVTIVLLVGLMLAFRQQVLSFRIDRLELPAWYAISLLLFALLILAYGFAYSAQTRGLIYFVKFLSIAIFFLVLLRIRLQADDFFKILLFVFLVNFLVLMFAIVRTDFQFAGSRLLLREGVGSRIFTTLNMGGMLWKTAFMVLPGLVYLYLRSSNLVWLLGALAAASVMGIDGSRTGLLFVALFLLSFLPLYWKATGWRAATLAKICLLGLVVISGLLIARPIAEQHITGKALLGAVERVPELAFGRLVTIVEKVRKASPAAEDNSSVINAENADTVKATGQTTDKSRSETISNQASTAISQKSGRVSPEKTLNRSGVQTAKDLIVQPDDNASGVTSVNEVATHNDQIRMRMITAGFEQIRSSPVWGGGIESSVVMTGGGPMVIHLSYLQVWGDYGLFGFLLFVIIMVLPLWILTKRVPALLTTRFSSIEQAGLLSALVVVLSYPLYGLLHPISNEFSDWAPMLMALAVIWNVTSKEAIGRATVDSSVRDHV